MEATATDAQFQGWVLVLSWHNIITMKMLVMASCAAVHPSHKGQCHAGVKTGLAPHSSPRNPQISADTVTILIVGGGCIY